jgi:hypothetical protein
MLFCRHFTFSSVNTRQTVQKSRQEDFSYGRELYLVLTTSKLSSSYSNRQSIWRGKASFLQRSLLQLQSDGRRREKCVWKCSRKFQNSGMDIPVYDKSVRQSTSEISVDLARATGLISENRRFKIRGLQQYFLVQAPCCLTEEDNIDVSELLF